MRGRKLGLQKDFMGNHQNIFGQELLISSVFIFNVPHITDKGLVSLIDKELRIDKKVD